MKGFNKGVYTALITPFKADNTINFEVLKKLILLQIENSITGIILCGTTGEGSTLSIEEKIAIFKFAIETANKRIEIIANVGSNNTEESVNLAKRAQGLKVDGLMVITPYYNKTNENGLISHFKQIADSVTLPIMLYNVPSRTNMNISIPVLEKLKSCNNIVAIKDASGDSNYRIDIISNFKNLKYFSGNDHELVEGMALGASGVVSVLSNYKPNIVQKIFNQCCLGQFELASKEMFKYKRLIDLIFIEVNPIPIKHILSSIFNVGYCRLPLGKLSQANISLLKEAINKL